MTANERTLKMLQKAVSAQRRAWRLADALAERIERNGIPGADHAVLELIGETAQDGKQVTMKQVAALLQYEDEREMKKRMEGIIG